MVFIGSPNKKENLAIKVLFLWLSQPFLMFEVPKQPNDNENTDDYNRWIAVAPVKFGHVGEVHAVPADEQGQRQENGGNNRKYFHKIVLLNGQLRLISILHLINDGLQILHFAGISVSTGIKNRKTMLICS